MSSSLWLNRTGCALWFCSRRNDENWWRKETRSERDWAHIYRAIWYICLLSYRYLALSNKDTVTISIDQESPSEKDSRSFIIGQQKWLIRRGKGLQKRRFSKWRLDQWPIQSVLGFEYEYSTLIDIFPFSCLAVDTLQVCYSFKCGGEVSKLPTWNRGRVISW